MALPLSDITLRPSRGAQESLAAHPRANTKDVRIYDLRRTLPPCKQQNDVFGHEGGDAVLRELGRLLKDSLRKEEFVLVLSDAALQDAARRAEQLREAVSRLSIPYRGRVIGLVTVSIGVAAFPEHGHDARTLLRAADAALLQAKRDGRDRISGAVLHPPV